MPRRALCIEACTYSCFTLIVFNEGKNLAEGSQTRVIVFNRWVGAQPSNDKMIQKRRIRLDRHRRRACHPSLVGTERTEAAARFLKSRN